MRKLILRCGLPPGDMVMLSAAIRDLHRSYPGRFLTDVRTFYPEIWEHNPHLTSLSDDNPAVEHIDCSYPLINHCNKVLYHCLHGFIEFLNTRLGLAIKLTASKGDIHLSDRETSWYSQVHELTGQEVPFWIVSAGGKYDVTIKWWETKRFQAVVDHFRGKIQFVQVGQCEHHHPKLEGVIDLRGQTSLRELIRLVYHAQGVLCPITALMHLAAAVETKRGHSARRPCVVIAGGREPAHWESYPCHQFIHVNGALACCAGGGCWKDRTVPLRDGEKRDQRGSLCVDVVGGLPRCMDMITPQEVSRRIEMYFEGGAIKYLSARQREAAHTGIVISKKNTYDQQPLNIHSAGLACEEFIEKIPSYPGGYESRGIIICGGGLRYFTSAWVCINMLRRLGCGLPIQMWYLGGKEMDEAMKALLEPLGVECVDACKMRRKIPTRILGGWELKAYSILHCRFREILLLDADNVPVVDPEFLFSTSQFKSTGAIFWPDCVSGKNRKARPIWRSCGLAQPEEPEFESGQIVVDKARCWRALRLSLWFNENSDFYYEYVHGDKETFHLAFRKLKQSYALVPKPVHRLEATMCQHDFEGRRIFQHRSTDKWDFLLCNRPVKDFWFEEECRQYIAQLQRVWEGRVHAMKNGLCSFPRLKSNGRAVTIAAFMISCGERSKLRQQTLQNLARTDWNDRPLHVQLAAENGGDPTRWQTSCAFAALKSALATNADYILFLEDDLDFNRHINYNLQHWRLLRARAPTLASLCNPGIREMACDVRSRSRIVSANSVFGSRAFLISRPALKYVVANWHRARGLPDIRIPRLARQLGRPILYHAPSLVQHIGRTSHSNLPFHEAKDFDPNWKVPA